MIIKVMEYDQPAPGNGAEATAISGKKLIAKNIAEIIKYVRTGFLAKRPTKANTITAPMQRIRVNMIGSIIISSPGAYGAGSIIRATARTIKTPMMAANTVNGPTHQSFFN